jgi:DNA-binding protein HU-beta
VTLEAQSEYGKSRLLTPWGTGKVGMYSRIKREEAVTKAEFVDRLAAKSGLTKKDAASVVDAFVEVVTDALKKGEDVQFTGFGKFYVQEREARQGINPQTKAKIDIPASKVPKFSAGLGLKSAIK